MNDSLLTLDNQTNIGDFMQNIIGNIGVSNPTSQSDYKVAKLEMGLAHLVNAKAYQNVKHLINQNQITLGAKYMRPGGVIFTDSNQIANDLKNNGTPLNPNAFQYLTDNLKGRIQLIENINQVQYQITNNDASNLNQLIMRLQISNLNISNLPIVQQILTIFSQVILEIKLSTKLVTN